MFTHFPFAHLKYVGSHVVLKQEGGSSSISGQSFSPSHFHVKWIQRPFLQRISSDAHTLEEQFSGSSELSPKPQSCSPSHINTFGIHFPVISHLNWKKLQNTNWCLLSKIALNTSQDIKFKIPFFKFYKIHKNVFK